MVFRVLEGLVRAPEDPSLRGAHHDSETSPLLLVWITRMASCPGRRRSTYHGSMVGVNVRI